jgi:Sec-independent protein translocase protein TatA
MIQTILLTIALCSVIFFCAKKVREVAVDICDILVEIRDLAADILEHLNTKER